MARNVKASYSKAIPVTDAAKAFKGKARGGILANGICRGQKKEDVGTINVPARLQAYLQVLTSVRCLIVRAT